MELVSDDDDVDIVFFVCVVYIYILYHLENGVHKHQFSCFIEKNTPMLLGVGSN